MSIIFLNNFSFKFKLHSPTDLSISNIDFKPNFYCYISPILFLNSYPIMEPPQSYNSTRYPPVSNSSYGSLTIRSISNFDFKPKRRTQLLLLHLSKFQIQIQLWNCHRPGMTRIIHTL